MGLVLGVSGFAAAPTFTSVDAAIDTSGVTTLSAEATSGPAQTARVADSALKNPNLLEG